MKAWVLLKETTNYRGEDARTSVMGVYEDHADLEARLKRIADANRQYRLRPLGENFWRVGPEDDDDEGFFGNRPVDLRAVETTVHLRGFA